jgi:hypothetical protein
MGKPSRNCREGLEENNMAIHAEFGKYGDEAKFTCDFLIPLFGRLGFYVVYNHGVREYGRDLILCEVDRFNRFIYHGVQAKYEPSIGQKESEDLINDCRQAFRHPFENPGTGAIEYISSFVVATAGTFGPNTPENFHQDARAQMHGGNVLLLDGRALIDLDRRASGIIEAQERRIQQLERRLSGEGPIILPTR